MTLSGLEFLRRFCQHILPRGYVRIRHFGLLSATKRGQLRSIQGTLGVVNTTGNIKKDWKKICRDHLSYDPDLCPHCKKGKMITIERSGPVRGPPLKAINPKDATRKQQ